MLKLLMHGINLVKSKLRDVGLEKRSGKWPTIEKHFRAANPHCAICHTHNNIQIHHCKPFHLYPELELDPKNLISLCMSKRECHLKIAHADNFRTFNPRIREDAEELSKDISKFDKVAERAKKNAIKM